MPARRESCQPDERMAGNAARAAAKLPGAAVGGQPGNRPAECPTAARTHVGPGPPTGPYVVELQVLSSLLPGKRSQVSGRTSWWRYSDDTRTTTGLSIGCTG